MTNLTTEDQATLVDAFTARFTAANDQGICAHVAFPEVMECESGVGLIDMLMESLAEGVQNDLPVPLLAAAAEHGLVIAMAYGMAIGAMSTIPDVEPFAVTFDGIPEEFLDWFDDGDTRETERD